MKRVHKTVYRILDEKPWTRDSDKELLLAYWESEGLYLTAVQQEQFTNCTAAESITRQRRLIQASGEFPASGTVKQYREELARETVQEVIDANSQNQIARQLGWIKE